MDWVSFTTGALSIVFVYALFANDEEEAEAVDVMEDEEVKINDFSGRHVTLSCQTCRKLKKHKEIKYNLFQCTKCKRHVDLRAS
jgi:acetyl-CoA carboxylase beta subunit